MCGTIKIDFQSFDEAVDALARLFEKLDSHQIYTDFLIESQGDMREQVGLLNDEFNVVKTTIGKLIDGTRIAFRETSEEFAAADK